ncbi:conserved hypothetical protein [Methanococcus vannielii SB]|uniref:Transglutaminase-like domain-containing protein n=1 Tax=Methanococcus vannielii (strain ATCC 35089 / DSM 1224 / JCM 13029 / OCM 148 / SB) TaxID=406327 RepID=A6UQ21_METVS|nr:transglutaminase-like domain-containing protein [Methanococcus vannielii]ABR54593.1 conserved hypothetical protein [Methanococcus vannielii SB]
MKSNTKKLTYFLVISFLAYSTFSFMHTSFDTADFLNILDKSGLYPVKYTSEKLPKYFFEDSIEVYLSKEELLKTKNISNALKGNSIEESIWNIIIFESENIEYDYEKALLKTPTITYWVNGKIEVNDPYNNTIQTPYETLLKKKGICMDYSLLTASILLNQNYSPIYILNFESKGNPGHAATAVNLYGNYYVIDQHPPILELFSYIDYKKNSENYQIDNITFYRIELRDEKVHYDVGFESVADYNISAEKYESIPSLSRNIMTLFEKNYDISSDSNIIYLDSTTYLPKGYEKGITLKYFFEVTSYDAIFHKQYSDWVFWHIKKDSALNGYRISDYNKIWVKSSHDGKKLTITLNLAKK